jgi:Holliday junction resolvasome RuvABC endonuclease subunit
MKKANLEKINKAKALASARKKASQKSDYSILSIDPATKCGVAYQRPNKPWAVELWDLTRKANESDGLKWMRFRAKIKELCSKYQIQLIVYERPAGQHMGAVIHHAKLAAVIEETAAQLEIECKAYSAGEIKNMATGKGNATKPMMIKAAQDRLGYTGNDDNEADALWLLQKAKSEL